jgi:DNA repair protein RecO (recombination protein O)
MAIIETEGLILKSFALAEADKIVVFLTEQFGLIRGVAKGAKRLKSRFGGNLEPFSIVSLNYFQKEERELVSISQLELKKSYFSNSTQIEFLQKFAYLTELLIEFAPPHEPNQRLYRMACVCLETAAQNPNSLENVVVYFELWLLRLAGYLPNWNQCEVCQRELSAQEKVSLQINFHLLCQNCQKTKTRWIITPEERQIFIQAQKLSPAKFVEKTSDNLAQVKEISIILKRIISNILGKEVVGEKILTAAPNSP